MVYSYPWSSLIQCMVPEKLALERSYPLSNVNYFLSVAWCPYNLSLQEAHPASPCILFCYPFFSYASVQKGTKKLDRIHSEVG